MKFNKASTEFRIYTWQWFARSAEKCGKDRSFLGGQVYFFKYGYRAIWFCLPYRNRSFGIWFGIGEIVWNRRKHNVRL